MSRKGPTGCVGIGGSDAGRRGGEGGLPDGSGEHLGLDHDSVVLVMLLQGHTDAQHEMNGSAEWRRRAINAGSIRFASRTCSGYIL